MAINDSWKIPVGYFLVDGASGEQRCNLVKQCISLARDAGVQIVSLTFDGAPSNFAMTRLLGCELNVPKNMITCFQIS